MSPEPSHSQPSNAADTSQGATAEAAGTPRPAEDAAAGPESPGLDEAQVRQLISALQDENEKLRAEVEAERDQHLRARAEFENFRRRMEREKAEQAKYAISKFAGDIVSVADNFDRAVRSVPSGATADDPTLKALLEGVMMTEREFLSVLERHGVRRVTPAGEPFNPHLHQAVMEVENPSVPTGTCVQVFQHGYTIEDRVLRPAMVQVSRGGPKLQKPAEANGEDRPPSAPGDEAGRGPAGGATDAPPPESHGST